MAEHKRLLKDNCAAELIMSSPDSSTNNHISRGVHNLDSVVRHRENKAAVCSGTYAILTQNPAVNNHVLSTGNKRLVEASPLDPVWNIDLQAGNPRASGPRKSRGTNVLGEVLCYVRDSVCGSGAGLAESCLISSIMYFHREHWISRDFYSAAAWPANRHQRLPRSSFGVIDLFLGRAGRPKP